MKNKTDAIQKSEFTSPTLVVRITETYRPGMTTAQICDCARWAWDADLEHASSCKLVLAVYKGEVVGAFEPSKCDFAANIKPPKGKDANLVAKDIKEGRVAFEGVDISRASPFVGRKIVMGQSPIQYFGETPKKINHRPKAL